MDVPEYRANAARTGVYPGPGPKAKPEVVWSRTAQARILFNPILADGLLIVGDQDGTVSALDPRTGAERWRATAGRGVNEVVGQASAADGTVVVSSGDGWLRAFGAASGERRWQADEFGGAATVIVDGTVYSAGTDGRAHGVDLTSGEEVWSWKGPDDVVYLTVDSGTAYVSVADGRLYAISVANNAEQWHFQTISDEVGGPMVTADVVYVNALEGQSPEPAGEIYALDRSTGEVLWRFRGRSGHQISLGAVADGVLYAGSVGDGIFAFPADHREAATVQPMWHTEVEGQIWKNAALVDDVLYLPTTEPGGVTAVSAGDGNILWTIPLAGPAQGLVVSGGLLIAVAESGEIAAYAESDLKAAIGDVASGPLAGASLPVASTPAVPNPFSVVDTFSWQATGLAVPLISGTDIGPDGLLYVLDTKPSVTVLDPETGQADRSWGRQGTAEGEFDLTRADGNAGIGALAVGPDGRVYVADGANHRVQVFEPDGTFVRQFGTYGTAEGQFSRIFHIAVGEDSSVYTVDHDLHYLSKFTAEGEFLWRIGGDKATDPLLTGILQDVELAPDGRVFLVPEDHPVILVLDAEDGTVLEHWEIRGGELSFDATGNLYTAWFEKVEVYTPNQELLGGTYLPAGAQGCDLLNEPVWGDGPFCFASAYFGPDGAGYASSAEGILKIAVDLS